MTVTLNISSQNLKITSGITTPIEKWGTLPVEPGLIKDGLILEPETIGNLLKIYFEKEHLPANEVAVCFSGGSYVYRMLRLPHLPAKRLREAIERATQKEINLDLADLYIDWDIVGDRNGEIEVFVTGIPRRSIEALILALNTAGIKPLRVELATLALARAAGQCKTLLVNLEPNCFDIVIVSAGIPVTMHSITPRSGAASLDDRIMQFTDELTRTINFFNLTHNDNAISQGSTLILAGSLAADPAVAGVIQEVLGYSVVKFNPEWVYPADFPVLTYSINLGLGLNKSILKTKGVSDSKEYRDINIDLLRGRKRTRAHTISKRKWLTPVGLTMAAIFLILMIAQVNESKVQSEVLKAELTSIIRQLNQRQLTLAQDSDLQKTINTLNDDTHRIQRDIELVAGKGELNQLIKVLTENLPDGVVFSDIDCGTKQITVNGMAVNRTGVIAYARALEKSKVFPSVRIALIKDSQGENTALGASFRLILER